MQVLASVPLPLVHDRVLARKTVVPDIVQRVLPAGVALDSPADADVLRAVHPEAGARTVRRMGAGDTVTVRLPEGCRLLRRLAGSCVEVSIYQ